MDQQGTKPLKRSFTEEYKHQAVGLVQAGSRSVGAVATELGLHETVLRKWVRQFGGTAVSSVPGVPTPAVSRPLAVVSADHAAENARLRRENERLRQERDILKKSIAIFAGASR
jgi:transposase